jgi:CDGSH-type Zn-finger protein/uncharacterized Fe-S cluster protein YjdI
MALEIVEGKEVRILFDGVKCIHSRHCVLSRPDVFVPNVEGAWIHPDRASVAEVAELAHACPSGAIRYENLSGAPAESAPQVNTVHVRENGPYAFHAQLEIQGTQPRFRATLCRCGASANKPYCDGSHTQAGFLATGEPATHPSEALAVRAGLLEVVPTPNGPLQVKGPIEIVSGSGRTLDRTTQAWLCRCGQSANKPYCDGSHSKHGFVAPGGAPSDS